MKKILPSLLAVVCCISLMWGAGVHAAPDDGQVRVLVLPFGVNAGTEFDYLNNDLPDLVAQRFAAKGVQIVPIAEMRALVKANPFSTLDARTARALAIKAKAQYAVYGNLSQVKESFSIDARLVDAKGSGEGGRPFFVKRDGLIHLLPAVDELVSSMVGEVSSKNAIAGVKVRGTKVLDPEVVLMRLSTRKGDLVDPTVINSEVKRIWDLGYFSDVEAALEQEGEGLVLVFNVKEKPRIENVLVEGSEAVSLDNILAAMSTKTGSVLNDKLLVEDLQKVTELYRKDGYYLAEVKHRLDVNQEGTGAVLVLNVTEGKKLYIQKIVLDGVKDVSESDIKKMLSLSEYGILSWLTGSGVLKEENLERDTQAITAYYMTEGYMDVQVGTPKIDYDDEGITLTFAIKEGPRFKMGEITFEGDVIDSNERLLEIIELDDHKKDVGFFSIKSVQNDIKKLTEFYSDYGYAFAEVDTRPTKHDDTETIDIAYIITKKQKTFVRRVFIEGNTKTRDNVIMRELRLADGDIFDGAKLRRSNERLNRLGYFSQADIDVMPVGETDEIDLKVKVKEKNTGSIMGGVGYSTYYNFGVTGGIQENNLFGRGYSASLMGFLSGKSNSLQFNFVNPRVNDTDLMFSNDMYVMEDWWEDFTKNTVGDTFSFGYPIGEYSTAIIGYRLDEFKLSDIGDDAPSYISDYEGTNLSSVAHLRLIRDTTDSRERPTKGTVTRLMGEYGGGGLGGDDNFFKPILEWQIFHTPWKNHTLHFRARGGAVLENSNKKVPVFDRFYLGGIDSIRGYSMSDMSPRDPKSDDEIGGDRMAFVNLEYIWTFTEEMGLALVPFFDMGFEIDSEQHTQALDHLKKSVGLEVRWRSPMGDLRFAYGYPLDKDMQGDKNSGRFEFTMGQMF